MLETRVDNCWGRGHCCGGGTHKGDYLDNWLVDITQEVTSRNWVDSLCEFKIAKSRIRHISVVSNSDSVA